MHGPLLLRGGDGIECCVGGAAVRVVSRAVGGGAAADRELALSNLVLDAGFLLLPVMTDVATWVEDSHQEEGCDHHGTLKDHEGDFLVGELALETVCEFCNTEARANENEEEGSGEH